MKQLPKIQDNITHLLGRGATPLRDSAYDRIKDLVIRGILKPGDYINEAALAESLNIGRTPINHAMHRLMLENFVVIMPRKGAYVRPLSLDDAKLIVDARLVNECHIARLAAKRADDAILKQMAACLKQARALLGTGDTHGFVHHDKAFHSLICEAAGNPVLSNFVQRLHDLSLRYWYVTLASPSHERMVQKEHEAILAAIGKRKSEDADNAMKNHILSFYRKLAASL